MFGFIDAKVNHQALLKTQTGQLIVSDTSKSYKFDFLNGAITAVYEIEHGIIRREYIEANEHWGLLGNYVVKTEDEHGLKETSFYSDTDGDGLYARISQAYLGSDGSALTETRHGSDADDRWNGTMGDDYYYGGLGNDVLTGDDGSDELFGADGDDYIVGGLGIDKLYGGYGNDALYGGDGDDYFYSLAGSDSVDGGNGIDKLFFTDNYSSYTIGRGTGGATSVSSSSAGSNSLLSVERLEFKDMKFASDTHADDAAHVIYAAFGKDFVAKYLGAGLSLSDSGLDLTRLCAYVTDNSYVESISGDRSTKGYVNALFNHVVGRMPSESESLGFTRQVDAGEMTRSGLLEYAARHSLTVSGVDDLKVDLIGIPYIS